MKDKLKNLKKVPHFEDKLNNTQKIAILRANALGDFIVTLPALHALRNAYPNTEVVLLRKPWHKQFFDQRPFAH